MSTDDTSTDDTSTDETGETGGGTAYPGADLDEEFTALVQPGEGVPTVVADEGSLQQAIEALSRGTGPVAIDAERASGYRYGQSAYLVQIRREGSGTWLIDPVPLPDLTTLDEVLAPTEWVLHAATQDIPCLAELGLRPRRLFDTELGARLAGLPRVGLSAVLEYYLGVRLAKEHSAVDWSTRPLPEPWLRYAALDVELLVPLRDRMHQDLVEQGKQGWAAQEFAALTRFTGPDLHPDPWRRTTGIQRVRTRRGAATVRELWRARDDLARRRDVASGRVLPDATLIDLAVRTPRTEARLASTRAERTPSRQRRAQQGLKRHEGAWMQALRTAAELAEQELPELSRSDAPPPPRVWADRDPTAADRLTQARAELAELSGRYDIPVENLLTPDTLRRVLWRPPVAAEGGPTDTAGLRAVLVGLGARPWQCDLVGPVLLRAVTDHPA